MARKWARRLVEAGLLLSGCYLAVHYIEPAWGRIDANERANQVMVIATASMKRPN